MLAEARHYENHCFPAIHLRPNFRLELNQFYPISSNHFVLGVAVSFLWYFSLKKLGQVSTYKMANLNTIVVWMILKNYPWNSFINLQWQFALLPRATITIKWYIFHTNNNCWDLIVNLLITHSDSKSMYCILADDAMTCFRFGIPFTSLDVSARNALFLHSAIRVIMKCEFHFVFITCLSNQITQYFGSREGIGENGLLIWQNP
jgi:hypothetical protein